MENPKLLVEGDDSVNDNCWTYDQLLVSLIVKMENNHVAEPDHEDLISE